MPKEKSASINFLSLHALMIEAMIAGLVFGLVFPAWAVHTKILGDIFIALLKMIITPLILTSIVVGMVGLGNTKRFKQLSLQVLFYFLGTTTLSLLTGLILVNLLTPGKGTSFQFGQVSEEAIKKGLTFYEFIQYQIHHLFQNPFEALTHGNVLGIIIFSIFLGLAIISLRNNRHVIQSFVQINDAILKVVQWIMYFAPLGIFGLLANILGREGAGVLISLGKFVLTVLSGLGFHFLITLPLILFLLGKKSPFDFFKKTNQAMLVAYSTSSSSATLPVTLEVTKNKLKVNPKVANFMLPLGATINMDGTALYEAVAALFIAQVYGIELTLVQQVIIFLTSMLASIGAASIPSAGLVTMVMVLNAVGLPLEGIALILATDHFLDMFRTATNVTGDMVGTAVISRFQKS